KRNRASCVVCQPLLVWLSARSRNWSGRWFRLRSTLQTVHGKDSNCAKPLLRREAISKRKAQKLGRARVKSSLPTESFSKTRRSSVRRKSGLGLAKVLVGRGKRLPAPAKNEFDRSRAVFLLAEPPISRTWLCGCSGALRASKRNCRN